MLAIVDAKPVYSHELEGGDVVLVDGVLREVTGVSPTSTPIPGNPDATMARVRIAFAESATWDIQDTVRGTDERVLLVWRPGT